MTTPSSSNGAARPRAITRRDFLRLAAITGSSAAFLAACAQAGVPLPSSGEEAAPGAAAAAESAGGGTMVWMGHQEVAGLSPNDVGPTVQWMMISNIHNALLEITPRYELEPVLAESYEVSADGLTYTFKLRPDVKFHDGTVLTSKDVKYTFDFYSNPDTGSTLASNFFGMASVETPDDLTVVIKMDEISADFLPLAATSWIVPADYHASVGEEVYRTKPIGTGAFKVKEWVPADYTLLEANEDHFRGRPKLDFIRQNVVPEPSVRAIALETGDADVSVWPLLVDDSLRLRDEGFLFYGTPSNSVKHFPINNKKPQFSDKRVRKALLMAIDRQRIIDELWSGVATVAHTYLTPNSVEYHKSDMPQIPYDPEAAKVLLDEAGWLVGDDGIREKDGEILSFVCTTITGDQARRPIAELTQQFFKEVGVEMKLEEAPVATILDGMVAGTIDMSLFNWTYGSALSPDPSNTLRSDGANNFSHWENARVDELIDLARTTVDVDKRREYYYELQDIFVDEMPFLPLQFDQWIYIFNPKVTGLPPADEVLGGDYLFPDAYLMGVSE